MTIRENLWVFNVGDKVTAEETNDNNETLQSWINDHSSTEAYIDAKMAELSTSLDASISSINTQISSLNNQISGLNNSALKISEKSWDDHYIIFTNGYKIQWGTAKISGYNNTKVQLKKAFAGKDYNVVYSWGGTQVAGDKKMNSYLTEKKQSYFTIHSELEGSNNKSTTIFWLATGH